MSRDVFNIHTDVDYRIKAFVQRQNPFLIFQHTDAIVGSEQFEEYYNRMLDAHPDCPLTNRMYHRFNRRSMRTLINGNACSRLLENKGEWIVMDTHYAQSPDLWRLSDGRLFQASYSCYLDTVIELIPQYRDLSVERFTANINMTLMADELCRFLDRFWHDRIILIDSRPSEFRLRDGMEMPIKIDCSFKDSSERVCELISERIPVHVIRLPEHLVSRDGNLVHYTPEIMRYIRDGIDDIVRRHCNPTCLCKG